MDEIAYRYCLLNNATDDELCTFLGINGKTLYRWDKEHPSFHQSRARGKQGADEEVAMALVHRAKGYSHKAVKIMPNGVGQPPIQVEYEEHYPPDTQAATWWLSNRRPDKFTLTPGRGASEAEAAKSDGPSVRIVGGLPGDEED